MAKKNEKVSVPKETKVEKEIKGKTKFGKKLGQKFGVPEGKK